MVGSQSIADFYNEKYKDPNYFHDRQWQYEPFIAGLVSFCRLTRGASVLDVGCGQGFYSSLLSRQGLDVLGVDLSATGIAMAQQRYADLPIRFMVTDVRQEPFPAQFDCVFVRSCSLYNSEDFPSQRTFTGGLLDLLKPGGKLIFVYNSSLRLDPSDPWRDHSMSDVREHFSAYPNARLCYVNIWTHLLLRRLSFTTLGTLCNRMISAIFGIGGQIVCVVDKSVNQAD